VSEHVVVVGAGIVGLSTAHHLRRRGLDVTVVDRGEVGRGATWGNAGWLVPSLAAPLAGPGAVAGAVRAMLQRDGAVRVSVARALRAAPWLVQFSRHCAAEAHLGGLRATAALASGSHESYAELASHGVQFTLRRDGLLAAFHDVGHAEEHRAALAPMRDFGYEVPELLDGRQLRGMEPVLSDRVAAGYLVAQEQAVDPVTVVVGLRERLLADGVKLREHWPVDRVVVRNGAAVAVRGPLGELAASHVVVAAGAWSGRVLHGMGVRVPLQAGKGYGLTLSPTTPVSRSLYFPEGRIGAAPRDEGLRVAGVMDLTGLETRLDPKRVASVLRTAGRFLSDTGDRPARDVWCGLRSVTPDGLPVIGRLPGLDNVTVGFGHAMLGVTLGPVTGAALSRLVIGERPDTALEAFRPDRFRIRSRRADSR